MEIIKINTAMIQLTQLLKWSGIVDTGGQSNIIINEGLVYVNGILVKEKRKKIYPGDQLSVKGKKYIVTGDYEINDES
jgi:ribosome-associated protein